jgi:hypothetical protein
VHARVLLRELGLARLEARVDDGHGAVVDEPARVKALAQEGLLRRVRVEAYLARP